MRQLIRLCPPALLLGAGLWLLSGCLPIPTFQKTTHGRNAASEVGDPDSARPLLVTRATRADVLRVLGPPYVQTDDGRTLTYTWTVLNGVTVWPLCFYAHPVRGQRTLVLRLDDAGILRSAEVLKTDEPVVQLSSPDTSPPLPKDIEEELERRNRELSEKSRNAPGDDPATTRPE